MSEDKFNDPLADFDPVMESAFSTSNDNNETANTDIPEFSFDEKTNTPITETTNESEFSNQKENLFEDEVPLALNEVPHSNEKPEIPLEQVVEPPSSPINSAPKEEPAPQSHQNAETPSTEFHTPKETAINNAPTFDDEESFDIDETLFEDDSSETQSNIHIKY